MYVLLWILFGGLIGWLASIFTSNNNNRMGIVANVIVGLIGAVIGGLIGDALGIGTVTAFTWQGTLLSVLGAIILLTVLNFFSKRR